MSDIRITLAVLLCAAWPLQATAQHRHHEHRDTGEAATRATAKAPGATTKGRPGVVDVGGVKIEIPDVEVLDQNGRKLRFYSDLIKGRVVVVSFFFTSCTFVCPPQAHALARLRSSLADRFGREVSFISVSKDPETDTPQRLKTWGRQFDAGGGWTLVTGEKEVMKRLVWDFTGEGLGQQMHSPILLIGNDRTGVWAEAEGLSAPEEVVREIDKVARSAEKARAGDESPSH